MGLHSCILTVGLDDSLRLQARLVLHTGFGGIGGILRYQVDFSQFDIEEVDDGDFYDSD